jgi:3-hydroxyacyl-[acyl-carrier-protein] dehydratase
MMLGPARVRDLLPHRYPMLLVDQVLGFVPGSELTALKAVSLNEPWYSRVAEAVDDTVLAYPEVLLLESWGQAAGLLALLGGEEPRQLDDVVMLLGGMSGVTFHRSVLPGDVIEHSVRVFKALPDTVIFEGEGRVGGTVAFEVTRMVMALRPADSLRPQLPVRA